MALPLAGRSLAAATAAVALLLSASPASADVSGSDIVSFMNAQRAANGIPAGITHDPARSEGCRLHNIYGAMNNELTHEEVAGRPGYTEAGKQAGLSSVLYQGDHWTSTSNPFETAPIHLHQLFAPRIDAMGGAENDGFGCATTQGNQNRPEPPANVTYTYPGNGATGWRTSEVANEEPFTPGERVGIPRGARTGPYLYVMFDGPGFFGGESASGTTATLTEPGGPVDIVVVDNKTPGLEGYIPLGAEIIPRQALKAGTTYTATVNSTVSNEFAPQNPARPFTYTWSFMTAGTSGGGGGGDTGGGGDGTGGGGDGTGGGGGAPVPYSATVPTTAKRGKAFKITIGAPGEFAVAYTVKSGRKTLKNYKKKSFAAGTRKTFSIKVPSRYSKKGKKVKLALKVTTGGTTYTSSRTIKFK
jgi:hypothetical protein